MGAKVEIIRLCLNAFSGFYSNAKEYWFSNMVFIKQKNGTCNRFRFC